MANTFNSFAALGDVFPSLNESPLKKQRRTMVGILARPKYVVVALSNGDSLSKVSVFEVEKGMQAITTQIEKVQPTRSGELIVKTLNDMGTNALLKAKKLFNKYEIKTYLHKTLNFSKGVIYSPELTYESEDSLKENLKSEKVVDVYRIKRKGKDGEMVNTPILILTFDTTTPPKSIKAGYLSINVREYVPSPLRCTQCQTYGHSKSRCKNLEKCGKCAQPSPHVEICSEFQCANCPGKHASNDKNCPTYIKEKTIMEIRTKDKLTYKEAAEKYFRSFANTTGANCKSYAQTTKAVQENSLRQGQQERELRQQLLILKQQEREITIKLQQLHDTHQLETQQQPQQQQQREQQTPQNKQEKQNKLNQKIQQKQLEGQEQSQQHKQQAERQQKQEDKQQPKVQQQNQQQQQQQQPQKQQQISTMSYSRLSESERAILMETTDD